MLLVLSGVLFAAFVLRSFSLLLLKGYTLVLRNKEFIHAVDANSLQEVFFLVNQARPVDACVRHLPLLPAEILGLMLTLLCFAKRGGFEAEVL